MSLVTLPYYANKPVEVTETKLGVQEISIPNLYDVPMSGKTIWRVDCMDAVYAVLPEVLAVNRNILYRMLAGYNEEYEILEALYRTQPAIRREINDLYVYGNSYTGISDNYLTPLRESVEGFKCSILERMKGTHNKFLVQTHYYLYYSVWNKSEIPDDVGGIYIC